MNEQDFKDSSYDNLLGKYEELLGKSYDYYMKVKACKILDIAKRFKNPQKLRCLDLGCGTGKAEEILFNDFKEILGLDISQVMIKKANSKKLKNCTFIVGDALKTNLSSNSSDVVFSICLLHHISKEKHGNLIKEAKRLAKRGGILIFFEHNKHNPITRYMAGKCPIDDVTKLLYPSYLKSLFLDNKIADVQVEYLLFFPRILSGLSYFEKYLKKIPLGGQYVVYGKKE